MTLDDFFEEFFEDFKFSFAKIIFRKRVQPETAAAPLSASAARPTPASHGKSVLNIFYHYPFIVKNVDIYRSVVREECEPPVLK